MNCRVTLNHRKSDLFQDFQASIIVENSRCASYDCRKCKGFVDIQDNGGIFKTLQVLYLRTVKKDFYTNITMFFS